MTGELRQQPGPLGLSARVIATALDITLAKASARYVLLPFFAVIAAVILSKWIEIVPLSIWAAANIALAAIWFPLKRLCYPRRVEAGIWPVREIAMFSGFIFVGACVWASAGVFAWVPGNLENNYVLLMMLVGDISIAMFTLAPMIALIVGGALPSLLLAVTMPFVHAMPGGAAIVALCVLYLAVLGAVSVVMRQRGLQSLRLREERADLVIELSRHLAQAERERDQALGANRSKTDFVVKVAHDLRGPLNAILGFSEIIRDEVLGPAGQSAYRRFGEDIHASGAELLCLIENLQHVLKLDAGSVELHPERLNLDLVIGQALHAAATQAKSNNVTLTMHVPGGMARLWADLQALECILDQLLVHAIRNCQRRGTVSVSAGVSPQGGILLRVLSSAGRDTDSSHPTSAGFGHEWWLPIARGLTQLHGGTLDLEAREDGGALMLLTFPPERSVTLTSIRANPEAA